MTNAIRIFRDHLDDDVAQEIPVAGMYTIDPQHTTVEFISRHLMITKVRGRLPDVSGIITIAEDPKSSHVEAVLEVASLTTGIAERDRHLRSPDFFNVDLYPQISFKSTAVQADSEAWAVTGDLTIHGLTRPVRLDVVFEGAKRSPNGDQRIGFSATTQVNREDWGLTWNVAVEAGGVLVSKTVQIEISVQAIASAIQ